MYNKKNILNFTWEYFIQHLKSFTIHKNITQLIIKFLRTSHWIISRNIYNLFFKFLIVYYYYTTLLLFKSKNNI